MLETVDRPMPIALARDYAIKAREDRDSPEVIVGIFSLYYIEMHALIDPGSTHSYICTEHVFDRMPLVEQLPYDMLITSPLGHCVRVNRVTPRSRGVSLTTRQPAEYLYLIL